MELPLVAHTLYLFHDVMKVQPTPAILITKFLFPEVLLASPVAATSLLIDQLVPHNRHLFLGGSREAGLRLALLNPALLTSLINTAHIADQHCSHY